MRITPRSMSVEELHGIFQFTYDLFDDENKKERILTVDKNYTPRKIYPGWYADELDKSVEDAEQTAARLMIPELYRRGEYQKAFELAQLCIDRLRRDQKGGNISGLIRDLTETQVCALLKLGRPREALPLLPLLDGVEEPGRLIVKSNVYFETSRYDECIVECRKYLALRPGDYFIATRLAECLIMAGNRGEEVHRLLAYALQIVESYLYDENTAPFLKPKYENHLRHIRLLLQKIQ